MAPDGNVQSYPMQQTQSSQQEMPSDPNSAQIQVISESKKSKWWIWLMVVLGIIIVGGAVYYFFFMK